MKLETKSDLAAAFWVILGAVRDAKESMNGGVPNGHLYASLMSEFDFEQWSILIKSLVDQGVITETNHLLKVTEKGVVLCAKLDAIFLPAAAGDKKISK